MTYIIKRKNMSDFFDVKGADMMERANLFADFLDQLKEEHHLQYKRVAKTKSAPTRTIIDNNTGTEKEVIYLASNDYLNLTKHPDVIAAGIQAMEKYGAGAGSVPLLGGTTDLHIQLENTVAAFKGCESALVFSSGYQSNATTLMALLGKSDVAILDMFAHASLIDGCKNTNTKYFSHNNLSTLEYVLKSVQHEFRTKLIIIDGVYSMDGDIALLPEIMALAKKYGAYVMMDDAHGTGVLGEQGRGTAEYFNVEGQVDIICGTFSKAVGTVGGFVAGNKQIIQLLNYYSRGYMFSTTMTPQVAGSTLKSLEIIVEDKERRNRLWRNIHYFRNSLLDMGFNIGRSETAIFPIIIGNDFITNEVCRELHEMNIYVNPVLYPAVSKKASRIRMSIMAEHTKEQLNIVLDALQYVGNKYGIIEDKPFTNENDAIITF